MRTYQFSMSVQKLLAVFIAFAVLLAPAFSPAGKALAAVPSDDHAQMMESGHCQSLPSDGDGNGQAAEKSCCIAMCTGMAVAPPATLRGIAPVSAEAVSAIASLHLAYLAEIATPPPKFA